MLGPGLFQEGVHKKPALCVCVVGCLRIAGPTPDAQVLRGQFRQFWLGVNDSLCMSIRSIPSHDAPLVCPLPRRSL